MSDHYYTNKPQSKHAPQHWTYQLRGHSFTFTSDAGVFSKKGIDYGTRLLIENFEEPSIAGNILDLGCGYGPIGIALAHSFPQRHIVMTDINHRAIQLTQQNITRNHIQNSTVHYSDLFEGIQGQTFASIVSNPPIRAGKKIVHQIFEQSKEALLPSGELWIVIQKKQGAPSAKEKLTTLFGNVEIVNRRKGYFILKASK